MAKVNDFARELSEKYGLSLGDASDFVSAMFDVVKEELDGADSSVKIKGFGTFKVSAVGARASVDVNTGERIIIDGRNKISFTPEVLLRDRVNRPFVQFETVVLNDGVDFSEIDEESEEELDSVTETEPQEVQLSSTALTSQSTDQSTDQSTNQPTHSEQPQGVQLSPTAPTSQPTDQSTDQPTLSEQTQGVQLSPTAPTSQPTDQSTDQPTLSEQTQGVQLSPTAPTSQSTDQLTDQPTLSEQPQGVQLSSTAPTDQPADQPAPAEQTQGVQLSPTAPTSQPTDRSTDQHAPAEQPQGVQLSPTAPTSQPTSQPTGQPTDQSANPQSPSVTASKAVNTEEHRDMARRLMTPKTETIEEGSENSDDKTTATAPEADDEGIVIGGCRQRSPRIMYVLTIASFLILVSLGIGMYFLYQRIEEKNHVIDRLESRLYAQQEAAERADAQPAVAVKDTIVPNDSLRAAELHAAEKAKKDSIAASKSAAEAKASQSSVAPSTATTPSDYNYDTRVRTGAYIIVGVAKTVTVQPGQTLASISKAYLGEGMECYVEVLNNRHSVKAGEKLKIPQLKLKPRKR